MGLAEGSGPSAYHHRRCWTLGPMSHCPQFARTYWLGQPEKKHDMPPISIPADDELSELTVRNPTKDLASWLGCLLDMDRPRPRVLSPFLPPSLPPAVAVHTESIWPNERQTRPLIIIPALGPWLLEELMGPTERHFRLFRVIFWPVVQSDTRHRGILAKFLLFTTPLVTFGFSPSTSLPTR